MERIVLEVDENTARIWKESSPEVKAKLEKNVEMQIEILARTEKVDRFFNLLDKISEGAVRNGLTEEILEKLLNEE